MKVELLDGRKKTGTFIDFPLIDDGKDTPYWRTKLRKQIASWEEEGINPAEKARTYSPPARAKTPQEKIKKAIQAMPSHYQKIMIADLERMQQ